MDGGPQARAAAVEAAAAAVAAAPPAAEVAAAVAGATNAWSHGVELLVEAVEAVVPTGSILQPRSGEPREAAGTAMGITIPLGLGRPPRPPQ